MAVFLTPDNINIENPADNSINDETVSIVLDLGYVYPVMELRFHYIFTASEQEPDADISPFSDEFIISIGDEDAVFYLEIVDVQNDNFNIVIEKSASDDVIEETITRKDDYAFVHLYAELYAEEAGESDNIFKYIGYQKFDSDDF